MTRKVPGQGVEGSGPVRLRADLLARLHSAVHYSEGSRPVHLAESGALDQVGEQGVQQPLLHTAVTNTRLQPNEVIAMAGQLC